MEQHPIPQNITAYKFRLVGDMTLKQFLELASGLVIAWLIFNSNANVLLRWTFSPIALVFGFALAFLPIEDRPLDQWIINFFKAIYQPTQFIYRPQTKNLSFLDPIKPRPVQVQTKTSQPQQLEEYLKSLPASPTTAFDQAEQKYLEHIRNLFGVLGNKLPKNAFAKDDPGTHPPQPIKSSVKGVRIRKLSHPKMCLLPHATVYQSLPEPTLAAMPTPQSPTTPTTPKPVSAPLKPTAAKPAPTVKPAKTIAKPKPVSTPIKPPPASTAPITQAVFVKDLIMPHTSDKPNLVSGITLDKAGKIVSNVILEIKDAKGYPVRALKSNKLGQFFIATSLSDGIYQIKAEHPDHRFAIIKLEAKGEIIPPLKIQSL